MTLAKTFALLIFALIAGLIGYQIGVSQNIAGQIPAVASGAPVAYWYGPHWYGFGFPFFGFLFPLLFFFLFIGLISAALRGARGWSGQGHYQSRRERFEQLHRELHGEKPQSGGTPSQST